MIRNILLSLFLFYSINLQATPKPIPPILRKLLSHKGSVQILNLKHDDWIGKTDLPANFKNSGQFFVKTNKDLFLHINGTGRLYKVVPKNDILEFKRIDSTYFSGYNFNSIIFFNKDKIYSFGGVGFWHTNGDLRFFDDSVTHEWNAIKLNKIIPATFDLTLPHFQFQYNDTLNNRLIISGNRFIQSQNLKNRLEDTLNEKKLFALNLATGDWKELGTKNFQSIAEFALTPFGIFSFQNLIDINNNKIYKYDVDIANTSLFGKNSMDNNFSITFSIDSTIYFGNAAGRFDSLTISRSNLIDTGEPAYFPVEPEPILSKEELLFYSLIATSAFSLGMIFLHFKKQNSTKNQIQQTTSIIPEKQQVTNDQSDKEKTADNPIYRSGKLVELMNEQEISFLKYLYAHSMDERMTTIEEINRKLGTFNKTVEIQKKMRSDMINGINSKLSTFSKTSKPVIDKQRSEFDKRTFEYFIHPDHMNLVENIIKAN